ncbi:hypothetical protein K488DRAFT_49279 [Vararia minispora EC-137]|uniref:Uncharacterized protein n=1 Tax=Vararia minispora EC-137 TaxID=1314806 RepID=A0ACB8QM09_9AGAM|nr:hypothetical protein K488DRAFT_49279 [Vararia minispora EC-137]
MPREARQPTLAYFQTSPVRGQLEPYQGDSRPGWRYLQCTDTPNELKVLLPPRTSTLYARLLQLETNELAKGPDANWERILEIRHLKDRMIRKCHRISRFASPPASGSSVQFLVVNSPPDFRLKEMERWLRTNDASNRTTRDVLKHKPSVESDGRVTPSPRAGHAVPSTRTRTQSAPRTSTASKKRISVSTQSIHSQAPTVPEKPLHYAPSYLSPVPEEGTLYSATAPADPYMHSEHHAVSEPSVRPNVVSPDPIPHPYRPPSGYIQPRQMYDELHDAAMHPPAIGMLPLDLGMPHPVTEMPEPVLVPEHPPPARVESIEDIEGGRPPIPRRRSGLRSNRNSFSGAGKVVSWAMDRDWSEHMTKFDHIVYSAEVAGEELSKAQEHFQDEIRGVKNMRENIAISLERLRLETERLQFEERALKEHEQKMTVSFERLRERESAYKDKVKAVLEETKRVVVAADGKRDNQVLG